MSLRRFIVTFGTTATPSLGFETGVAVSAFAVGLGVLFALGGETLFLIALFLLIAGIVEGNKFLLSGDAREKILGGIPVGVWFAMLTPLQVLQAHPTPIGDLVTFAIATALFLFFRNSRISTIGWLYRRVGGALGVMLSDLLAGFAAGMATLLVTLLLTRFFT